MEVVFRISDDVKKPKIHVNPINRGCDENQEQTEKP
jgi:hypothetical protein